MKEQKKKRVFENPVKEGDGQMVRWIDGLMFLVFCFEECINFFFVEVHFLFFFLKLIICYFFSFLSFFHHHFLTLYSFVLFCFFVCIYIYTNIF
ncbi:hypothetical protein DFH28DRAFT_963780 [Melampsora americana]|nr:hypothetical protein DFH28DRAFT_963780 [Melampsora americana]